jgi:DNA-binding LacI/PurR family transcriptional regulator/signal transduction histidine kinase/ActR/RegA family two-component response regulator
LPVGTPSSSLDGSSKNDDASPRVRAHGRRLRIGVLLDYANYLGGSYEYHLREALDAKCRRDGHTLLLLYGAALDAPHPLGKADNAIFRALKPDTFDGFIVASAALSAYSGPERVAELVHSLRPAKLCSLGIAFEGIPSLVIDNRAGMVAAVEHMVERHGCRRPVFLAGTPKNPDSEERYEAYLEALAMHGLPFDPNLVACADFRNELARDAVDDILKREVAFDSVVAANDTMAVGAIESLRKWGRRVPLDIPVTGFDDQLLARAAVPPLTTVAQPYEQMAELAVDTIVAQLSGQKVPERVALPTRLVCRQSCGCTEAEQGGLWPSRSARPAGSGVLDRIEALRPTPEETSQAGPDSPLCVADRLIDGLRDALSGKPEEFRSVVGQLLAQVGEQHNPQQLLQDAITKLRDGLADLGNLKIERALFDGLSLVAMSSASARLQYRMSVDDSNFRLLTVGAEASVALDLESLKQALRRSLPGAGIRTIFLSCAPDSTTADLVPLVCMVDGAEVEASESRIPASRLLPSLAFEQESRRTFLVFPMALGSQLLGVAGIDYQDGIYKFAPFRSEIILVLRSIHLHQDLVQETRLRERSVLERLATTKRMEALSVLAGGVAHDLNNTLGPLVILPDVILGELDRLRVPSQDLQVLREDLTSIRAASLRAAQTIKDLLTLGRQGRTARQNLDLNSVVRSCLAEGSLSIVDHGQRRIRTIVDLHGDPLPVRGAESQLARAVGNLVRNAVEAIAGEGEISVKTSQVELTSSQGAYETIPPGRYAMLAVSDNGCGIAEGDLSHIFEPFFTTKPAGERSGSGLGLAIVHGVLKEHEGYIDVHSSRHGGTTFALYFPLVKAPEFASLPHAPRFRGRARILVVDDEPFQLRICQRVLSRLGHEIETISSGVAAHDLLRKTAASGRSPYDLIIMDMVLGEEMDGLQVVEAIRQLFPSQKAILASGHAPNQRVEQAIEKGLPWLAKPYVSEALETIVERTLAGGEQDGAF